MSATYTVDDLDELRYGVVQVQGGGPPGGPPELPGQVPKVAQDAVPERHDARTTPGGGYKILLRHVDEDDPMPDADIDWIDHTEIRVHIADNRDVWEGAGPSNEPSGNGGGGPSEDSPGNSGNGGGPP